MEAYDYVEPGLFGPEEPICPYTGLRTFTEDEAIYFRGREAHVAKCLTLLAAERFVMVTGASGDGKSSLVFAGLLPEVRAGFLRGRYSNWAVATFRPERSPLRNMARALAAALRLESSAAAVETELEQGFSALVQLYQASALCPPAELPAGLPATEQRQQQRQAANLLMIVDQFEEFFTNPENYSDNGPNTAAQTVVNLLLETTRLAQVENLPIYIVCTMRSDFVGQCAEFRGLIEQIGTSQYFVPRLLRHEFVEVIKEPALLSGNRISERLVQRLLYDMHNGQDQLPVLQHALRRIWLAADEGREEMDLLHYAKVGGLAADELPPADQARFGQWQAALSEVQQQFLLAQPSLRNVLDAHANQLYYESNSFYNNSFKPPLPPGTAERVIERTFRVLTRTDGHRVVRNRLTGAEITAILNDPALPWPVVCRVLRPFRQADATFVSPFLLEAGPDQEVLPPDAVLDITHESLIRNWTHLAEWASSEAEDVRVAKDLLQQADRWQANAKNQGFLLPIGPYSYFAQWRAQKQPSASWLAYYVAGSEQDAATRQTQAAVRYAALTRFLKASRRRLRMPLLVARYGLGRLAIGLLLLLLLAGAGWWGWASRHRQADYVAGNLVQGVLRNEQRGSMPTLQSPYVPIEEKAHFLLNTDRLKDYLQTSGSSQPAQAYAYPQVLDKLADDSLALNIELSMFSWADNLDFDSVRQANPYLRPLLLDVERRLDRADSAAQPGRQAVGRARQQLAVCTARLVMALTYYLLKSEQQKVGQPLPRVEQLATAQQFRRSKHKLLARLLRYVQREIETSSGPAPNPVEFGFCLRVLLGQGDYRPAEIAFLEGINPFGASAARRRFRRIFPPALRLYTSDGSTARSGGYLASALIFAARQQPAQVMRCLDSLRYQVNTTNEGDAGIALVPYLIKYELLTPGTTVGLLRGCSQVGEVFSFNEMYAATVYCLLSASPSYEVHDVAQGPSTSASTESDAVPTGAVNADYLNLDRVSFSVPWASRAKAWQALQAVTPAIARQETLFTGRNGRAVENRGDQASQQRNTLFLQAFLAKMHGTYLAELRHQSAAAEAEFAQFSASLQALRQVRQPGELVYTPHWNLGTAMAVGATEAGSVGTQDPITYLQEPTRPKTQLFERYYTCAFDAFFDYELRHATEGPAPDYKLVQLLDSVALVEAVVPDRFSATRSASLRAQALMRPPQFLPNRNWLKALAKYPGPNSGTRRQHNQMLLLIATALQDSAKLQQLELAPVVLPFAKLTARQPTASQSLLQLSLADLAAGLARAGRVTEAFALADALSSPLATSTKIRISEQLMLTDNGLYQRQVDKFLHQYLEQHRKQPWNVATNILAVLCWRSQAASSASFSRAAASFARASYSFVHQEGPFVTMVAAPFVREGNSFVRQNGPYAISYGLTLADNSAWAVRCIPAYSSEQALQAHINHILTGIAHLHAATPGWRQYDELQLTTYPSGPADYDGPN